MCIERGTFLIRAPNTTCIICIKEEHFGERPPRPHHRFATPKTLGFENETKRKSVSKTESKFKFEIGGLVVHVEYCARNADYRPEMPVHVVNNRNVYLGTPGPTCTASRSKPTEKLSHAIENGRSIRNDRQAAQPFTIQLEQYDTRNNCIIYISLLYKVGRLEDSSLTHTHRQQHHSHACCCSRITFSVCVLLCCWPIAFDYCGNIRIILFIWLFYFFKRMCGTTQRTAMGGRKAKN